MTHNVLRVSGKWINLKIKLKIVFNPERITSGSQIIAGIFYVTYEEKKA